MLQKMVKSIMDVQDKQNVNYFILTLIEPILRRFDGKKITKRIETAIKKELPEYTISYGFTYSWYSLKIWGNGISWDDKIDLQLGYNEFFDMDEYIRLNQRYYLESERYNTLQGYLDDLSKLKELVALHTEVKDMIKKFEEKTTNLPWPVNQFMKLDRR